MEGGRSLLPKEKGGKKGLKEWVGGRPWGGFWENKCVSHGYDAKGFQGMGLIPRSWGRRSGTSDHRYPKMCLSITLGLIIEKWPQATCEEDFSVKFYLQKQVVDWI